MTRVLEKACWYGIVGVVHFLVVPGVMLYAGIRGLGTERRLRGS